MDARRRDLQTIIFKFKNIRDLSKLSITAQMIRKIVNLKTILIELQQYADEKQPDKKEHQKSVEWLDAPQQHEKIEITLSKLKKTLDACQGCEFIQDSLDIVSNVLTQTWPEIFPEENHKKRKRIPTRSIEDELHSVNLRTQFPGKKLLSYLTDPNMRPIIIMYILGLAFFTGISFFFLTILSPPIAQVLATALSTVVSNTTPATVGGYAMGLGALIASVGSTLYFLVAKTPEEEAYDKRIAELQQDINNLQDRIINDRRIECSLDTSKDFRDQIGQIRKALNESRAILGRTTSAEMSESLGASTSSRQTRLIAPDFSPEEMETFVVLFKSPDESELAEIQQSLQPQPTSGHSQTLDNNR